MGPAMMADFRRQAEQFGAEYLTDDVTKVDFSERPFRVWVGNDEYRAKAVIVATGATARQLGLESERALQGRGVTYCATCDGAFYRDREVIVVGGGDSAMEEALFLTKFASKVTLIHRRDEFRASQIMIDRAQAHEKIEFRDAVRRRRGARRRRREDARRRAQRRRVGRDPRVGGGRSVRRNRARPDDGPLPRPARPRRGRVPRHCRPARPRRTSPASSRRATSRTTRTGRRSPPPVRAVWPRSTPSAGWRAGGPRGDGADRPAPQRPARGLDSPAMGAGRPRGSTCSTRPREELDAKLPREVHDRALEQLLAPAQHDDEPRPKLESHGDYVFGVFLVPVVVSEEDTRLLPGDRPGDDARRARHVRKTPAGRPAAVGPAPGAGGVPRPTRTSR